MSSKKLTWEVDKTSLVLKVTDGAKETTWKLRKSQGADVWTEIFSEMLDSLGGLEPTPWEPLQPTRPMFEPWVEDVRTVDAEELAELQRYNRYETSEEASRAAQAAEVRRLNISAKWFEADDDETYGMPIPDYDTGEVRPR